MNADEQPRPRSGKQIAMGAEWRRLTGRDLPGEPAVDAFPQLPAVAAGQQVIDRRNSDTYRALGWQPDMTLKAAHADSAIERLIPWRDVVPAGRARKARR